jgi:DNA-binding MarR family transcriptional regulator
VSSHNSDKRQFLIEERRRIVAKCLARSMTQIEIAKQLGFDQSTISDDVREGLIEREAGESEHGHFKPVYNRITDKGRQVLQSQLAVRIKEEEKEVNKEEKNE